MPPRKRARVSQASTPQPKQATETKSPETPADKPSALNDPWTDDEETLLFKSMIKWKPTGVHKHFRMIAIQHQLHSHGFTSHNLPHTRIPGIWAKLDTLYDLETLNKRENSVYGILATPSDTDGSAEEEDEGEEGKDPAWKNHDFELPDEDYRELAWQRRYSEGRPSSPEAIEGMSRTRNVLGDDEMRELREQYEPEDTASVKGRGKKGAASKLVKAKTKGVRSTRSTPADAGTNDEEDDGEEEESQLDDSPQSKTTKKVAGKAKTTRRTRRR